MPMVVTEPCFGCRYTDCVSVCPVDAFREGEQMLFIDPEACICCSACIPVCPVGAIFEDVDVPQDWEAYIELNAEMSKICPTITDQKPPLADADS